MADRNDLQRSRDGFWAEAQGSAQVEQVAGMAKGFDFSTSDTLYRGWANVGSSSASAVWRIQRISISDGVYTFEWADGDADFDNVWDDRASLSYS